MHGIAIEHGCIYVQYQHRYQPKTCERSVLSSQAMAPKWQLKMQNNPNFDKLNGGIFSFFYLTILSSGSCLSWVYLETSVPSIGVFNQRPVNGVC
jgi:hypothetical protein